MRVNKMLSLFAVISVSLFIAIGCGGKKEQERTKPLFGYIAYDMKDIWNMYSSKAFEYAATQVGADVLILDSENNLEKSINVAQQLIDKKVDGISIFPISPDQAATVIRMANEANIPITVENLMVPEDSGKFVSIVACKYDDIGYAAIKYIAENFSGAKILFVAGALGGGVYETYKVGVDKALNDYKDKVTLVATVHGDWETAKAMNVTQSFIQSKKEFNVIFANNDLEAIGSYNALKEAGLDGKIPIISTGGAPEAFKMIEEGVETANMTAPVSIQGAMTFKNIWDNYKGRSVAKFTALPIIPIDKNSLDKKIDWQDYEGALKYIGGVEQ